MSLTQKRWCIWHSELKDRWGKCRTFCWCIPHEKGGDSGSSGTTLYRCLPERERNECPDCGHETRGLVSKTGRRRDLKNTSKGDRSNSSLSDLRCGGVELHLSSEKKPMRTYLWVAFSPPLLIVRYWKSTTASILWFSVKERSLSTNW